MTTPITTGPVNTGWDEVWEEVEGPGLPAPRRPRRRRGPLAQAFRTLLALSILLAAIYTGSAVWELVRVLDALDHADSAALAETVDIRSVQSRLGGELAALAHQSAQGNLRPGAQVAAEAYLDGMARETMDAWGRPQAVATLVHFRLSDPGMERAYGATPLRARVRGVSTDGLEAFRLDLAEDPTAAVAGIGLCFGMGSLFSWRLITAAWPEFGGRC